MVWSLLTSTYRKWIYNRCKLVKRILLMSTYRKWIQNCCKLTEWLSPRNITQFDIPTHEKYKVSKYLWTGLYVSGNAYGWKESYFHSSDIMEDIFHMLEPPISELPLSVSFSIPKFYCPDVLSSK